jgi:hypothetical protein
MPYTMEDFRRDYVKEHLGCLTSQERLEGLTAQERLQGLHPEALLRRLSVEERLQGLPAEQLEAYLERLRKSPPRPSDAREGAIIPCLVGFSRRDYVKEHLGCLTPQERLRGLPPEERLKGVTAEDLLSALCPEERLQGLPAEQVEAYLERLQGGDSSATE